MIPMSQVEMGKKIGSGGYGVVYAGKWQGKEVAVKMVQQNLVASEIEEFKHEAMLMVYVSIFLRRC